MTGVLTVQNLLDFEEDIAQEFAKGKIKAPIHLGGGNERQLIKIFEHISPDDWVLGGWRTHYICLLKGVPPTELKKAIMEGKSVALCFPEYKILSSGIMGGIASIALGLAWAMKEKGDNNHVIAFLGDMTAMCGVVHECKQYAGRRDLHVTWVVEDNGLSVMTPTQESWGELPYRPDVVEYKYTLTRPHSGIGQWVRF
jgi:TPP-dependent pyruvate/acetoin dehydrogenase alpha subunit